MGASISVKLTQKSKNETARTANVGITVTVTSTAGTHNHFTDSTRGAVLYLTIDEREYSYVTPFGSEETGTFTSTIYSSETTVSYDSDGTKTVVVSAVLATGVSAGTVSDSASLTLPSIGSSGGSSGGGSEEGGDDDEGGGNTGGGGTTVEPGNATILGQAAVNNYVSGIIDALYDTSNTALIDNRSYQQDIAVIKFVTPKFDGVSASVNLTISTETVYKNSQTVNVGISTDDDSFTEYINNSASVSDPYQIASGTIQLTSNGVCSTNIPTTQLKSETTYYIFLWLPTTNDDASATIQKSTKHSITVNYTTAPKRLVHIDTGSEYGEYQLFIDNGTSWDEYEVYVDNGTTWDLYG